MLFRPIKMKEKYLHTENFHNLESPREIVPEIIKLLKPKSVVDVGCGLGTFLYCFKENGVTDVLGIDGSWVNKELLFKYIAKEEFLEKDLEKPFILEKKFDLVISLEVAEHISESSSDIFVKNLISSGELILFSTAIPFQRGHNHINEQWLSYWEEKFLKYEYIMHDVIRPIFWNNPKIFTWYKQNMILITHKDLKFDLKISKGALRDVVHYDLFIDRNNMLNRVIEDKSKRLKDIVEGKLTWTTYVKYLIKSIIGIKNIIKIKSIFK